MISNEKQRTRLFSGVADFCNSERGVEKGRGVGWGWEMEFASLSNKTKGSQN